MTRLVWLAIVLLGAAPARAQLIRNAPAEKAASEMSPSEALADLAKRRTRDHQAIAPDQVDADGLPAAFAAVTNSIWPNPKQAERDLAKLRQYAQSFGDAWTKYEA